MNKSEKQETKLFELMLICAEIQPQGNGEAKVRFGSQANEEVLIQMCKEDEESWELFKKVIFDTLDKIETAGGYKLNDDGTEVIRPE
ncbi:MAG: hypothetical protein J5982_03405 [Bacilli bacterium]|nr:hypothetical protein [Bacilli bacterium]